uniref:Golgi associated, gamma adaptin ear containing, ARF binding protein 2 n=1 Tax=Accipiter nisus TaxID=211598 RepID=A0A8B9MA64_9AVES
MCACFARQQGEEQSEVGGSGGVCFTEPAHTHSLHFHATKTHGGEWQHARNDGGWICFLRAAGRSRAEQESMAGTGELEQWLNKATDPSIPEENWECIQRFCDQVNGDIEGPSLALRLLAHKIQSPQEMEALHALTVLETCVNNCGERFHKEIAKFRFLNELIKVLSPKYYGTWSSEKVKSRVTEVIFSWTVWFPQEVKIRDAYQMLKKQGIVKEDPKLPEDKILPPPSPRPQNSIFDTDEEKSKLLARLLKSNHSEDLQAANRLIKSMIKEEQEKSAKVSRRVNTISEVSENVKRMDELLENYKRQELSKSDQESLQTLFQRCEKLRPLLFRLASETVDDDEALAEILQANDKLTQVLGQYRQVVARHENGDGGGSATSSADAAGKEHPAAFHDSSAPARHV